MTTFWHSTFLAPAPGMQHPRGRDDALEGLRGAAALAVLYGHLTAHGTSVDREYAPPVELWWIEASVMAVLLFFMLSGYVIGLTNPHPASREGIRDYLRRRALRLLPVYFAAVGFGWLARPGPSFTDLAGHLLFLQNEAPGNPAGIKLLLGNGNLWSLHNEVIYYLVFIALWWLRPRLAPLVLGTFLLAALGAFMPGMSLYLAWLACGFIFWLTGLLIAWKLPQESGKEIAAPWPSVLILCVVTWRLQGLAAVLARSGFKVEWVHGALFSYLDSLPVLFWLLLLVTRRRLPWQSALEICAWTWPFCYLAWRLHRGPASWSAELVFIAALLVLAFVLRAWRPSLAGLQRLAPVGAISYGIYAFGAPVQLLVREIVPAWSGRWWTYSLRLTLTLGLTAAVAWFFERWLQPRIAARFGRRPHPVAQTAA